MRPRVTSEVFDPQGPDLLMCQAIHWIRSVGVGAFLLVLAHADPGVAQVDPGVIGRYFDGEHTVHRVVPTPSFALAADESLHPQIAPGFNATYIGVLRITRGAEYTLSAAASGDVRVEVDGDAVVGKPLKLAAGDHALRIDYRRREGPARLQLRWRSDFFVEEPIPPRAFGHVKTTDPLTEKWKQIEQGRSLYEDLSCGACHGAGGWNLSVWRSPDLSDIGSRVTSDWLYTWLRDPRHYRKTTAMPSLLSTDDEARDVAAYLSKLAASPADGTEPTGKTSGVEAGREIFHRIGCDKCHRETDSLAGVGAKFRSTRSLAEYLANPLHVDPSGRMPQLFDPQTQSIEVELVAAFLFQTKRNSTGWAEFSGGNANRGRELVQTRGCLSCHTLEERGQPLPDETGPPRFTMEEPVQGATKKQPVSFDVMKGCLAENPRKGAPDYRLSTADRAGLRALLGSLVQHPVVAAAPIETLQRRVAQYKCIACHSLNHQNEGPAHRITKDGRLLKIERPPSLTGVGDKLRVDWIRLVLLERKRTRPWMRMRMPHFGTALADLPALFPASSGSTLEDEAPAPGFELAGAGLDTIGVQRGKVACIDCHDYRGINQKKEGVVPAPDMSEIARTLRRDWFRRWLRDPARMQPGTSMPQLFLELKADAWERKIDELWSALYHHERLPLPRGVIEKQTEGTRVVVRDEPVVLRLAIIVAPNQQVDRAINVGLPGRTNFTFDAATARLRHAWKGDFLNAASAWNGRGGNPVSVQGQPIYLADHFPLRIGSASAEPVVRFLGYFFRKKHPVFRYRVDSVEVHEQIDVKELLLVRRFSIGATPGPVFFVAEKGRTYTSPSGPFRDDVLEISAGKRLAFEVHTKLTAGPAQTVDSLSWIATGDTKPPNSRSGPNASVIFENRSGRSVKIYWVGYGGQLRQYGKLDPGSSYRQGTYANNTWLITDEKDEPLGHFIARPQVHRAVIPGR